jgi:DNA-binding NarL/FixJ family response regulator
MRVVIADDSGLLRDALAQILTEANMEVCATVADAPGLLAAVDQYEPQVAVIDIRMPPTFTHEGAQAAIELRTRRPLLGILLLSQSLESRYAAAFAQAHPEAFGYLLKDRVAGASTLVDAVVQIAAGGTVLDPQVVTYLLRRNASNDRLRKLTQRERDILTLMAEGRSNAAISRQLFLNAKTVEGHIANVFLKLGLHPESLDNRRVLAVLAWLHSS